jgi:hypothetical protein
LSAGGAVWGSGAAWVGEARSKGNGGREEKMKAEKTLSGLMRGLPSFVRMEETKGLGKTFKNQWGGGKNTAKIV